MSGGGSGDDWSENLFKPEKGDSLGDGSWGRESDEPELAPVAWDKLPEAPKNRMRARLATPAPGSQKESGLLDIRALAPELAKGMKDLTAKEDADADADADADEAADEASDSTNGRSLSSSLVDQPVIPQPSEEPELVASVEPVAASRSSLMFMVGLLALAVAGLAVYVLTRS